MTHSGAVQTTIERCNDVLIPLLLDDPLWVSVDLYNQTFTAVLIPLLLDDPLWEENKDAYINFLLVLIPLLLDDPLWVLCS